MDKVLYIISFLCMTAVPVLAAAAVWQAMKHRSVKILVHGIIMLVIFAVLSFILGSMLGQVS